MRFRSFVLVLTLLFVAASAVSAAPPPDTAITPSIPVSALDDLAPLTTSEMTALAGGAPSWLVGGCAFVSGILGGREIALRSLAKQAVGRAVVGVACPACGVALTVATVAAVGCLFL